MNMDINHMEDHFNNAMENPPSSAFVTSRMRSSGALPGEDGSFAAGGQRGNNGEKVGKHMGFPTKNHGFPWEK